MTHDQLGSKLRRGQSGPITSDRLPTTDRLPHVVAHEWPSGGRLLDSHSRLGATPELRDWLGQHHLMLAHPSVGQTPLSLE